MKRLVTVVFNLIIITTFSQSTISKVGYADVGYIVSRLPEFKNFQEQYAEAEKSYSDQLQQKGQAFQKQYSDYMTNAAGMADTARANAEQKLQEAQAGIQAYQAEAQQSLQNYQKLLLAPVYLAVNSTIRTIAAENGFTMVLNARVGNSNLTLYHESQFDISDLVIDRMTAKEEPKKPAAPAKKTPTKKN